MGVSADNIYYFDGINVTDPVTGTFGANLNTEIIQEQKVITGAIPAEYVGAPGLISNVITKSGSNAYQGSVNYFFQNSSLVAENQNGAAQEFSTKDNGYTLGGPILRDKVWFFGSYRYTNREDDVSTLDTNEFMRTVDNTQHQGFFKGSWAATQNDLISFTYLSDPTDITGRSQRDITNARDRAREQGGARYSGNYTRVFGSTLVEVGANKHNGEVSDFSAIRQSRSDVLFQRTDVRTLTDEQQGGFGRDLIDQRDNKAVRGTVQHTFGDHTIKGGFEWNRSDNFRDTLYVDSSGYSSLAPTYAGRGITAGQVAGGSWTGLQFDVSNTSDFNGFIRTIDGRADRAKFYNAYDVNRDGVISQVELAATMVFNTTSGNPVGGVNYDRDFQAALGPQETYSNGLNFFVQDQWTLNRLSLNLGVRMQRWEHFATTGENIFTFDWDFAPRLSAVYDLLGDGRHKVSAFWGRYYDPVRNNLTNFAGTLTGSILEEQVWAIDSYVTYRTRGGPAVQDAFFSPSTKTPYTDDLQIAYAVDLGRQHELRRAVLQPAHPRHHRGLRPRALCRARGLQQHSERLSGAGLTVPRLRLLRLRGEPRLELRHRHAGRRRAQLPGPRVRVPQALLEPLADADVLQLERRQGQHQLGQQRRLPGRRAVPRSARAVSVRDAARADRERPEGRRIRTRSTSACSSAPPSRGTPARWRAARSWPRAATCRCACPPPTPTSTAGTLQRWLAPDAVGSLENPAWGQLDVRAQYVRAVGPANVEFFVDMFNLLNTQDPTRNQDLVAGTGTTAFGDPIAWVNPRRAFLGARLRF